MEKERGQGFVTNARVLIATIVLAGLIGVAGYVTSEKTEGYEKRPSGSVSASLMEVGFGSDVIG